MHLQQARELANYLLTMMQPYTVRIEIAGSIRREVAEVKDIELVLIPRTVTQHEPDGLFGATKQVTTNRLHEWALSAECPVRWIKPGTSEIIDWAPKPDGKYWRGELEGIKLDCFLTTPKNFGAIYLIRTGSADFSHAVATHAQRINRPFQNGSLTIANAPIETPEEADVFERLGLRFVAPHLRTGADAVVRL